MAATTIWRPSTFRVSVWAHVGFIVGVLVIAAMWLSLYSAAREADSAADQVDKTRDVLVAVAAVNENLARAESAQRGFLISGDASFIAERDAAFAALRRATERFRRLTDHSAATQHARAQVLANLVEERASVAREVAERRQREGLDLEEATELAHAGQRVSTQVYALTKEMHADEVARLDAARALERRRQAVTTFVLVAALLVTLTVVAPAYAGVLRQARQREVAERRLADIARSLPVTIYRVRTRNGDSRFEYLSDSAAELRGLDVERAYADISQMLVPALEEDRPMVVAAAVRALEQLAPFEVEYRVVRRDGSVRWVRSTAALRRDPDGSVVWNGCWFDVTERRELIDALERSRIEADAANRAKSAFLAAMSHEIRTPMNGMLGMLELLALSRLDDEQHHTLTTVRESANALLRIIDDILEVSKIEAGQLRLEPHVASVADVVERTCRIYAGMARGKQLLLTHEIDPAVAAAHRVDAVRLGQILNNLVSNALKFTDQGRVQLRLEQLERRQGHERLRFVVEDTGIGISKEAQARLFEPFVQGDRDTAARYGGTGLGLVICKRLAEMMDGTIEMDSAPGRGTLMTVTLTLPLADAAELPKGRAHVDDSNVQAVLATRRSPPSEDVAAAEGTLVLVVDDHPVNLGLLVRQVELLGYAAVGVDNGAEALRLWKQGRFALLITDCNMPHMSGYDLARAIRAREGGGRVHAPIIACTADVLASEAQACFDAGMDDALVKPVQLHELIAVLDRWLPLPSPSVAPPEVRVAPAAVTHVDGAPIDPSTLDALGGAGSDLQRRALAVYRRVNNADAEKLRTAVRQRDAHQVWHLAHRIKGASRSVGAATLAAVAERIEQAGRTSQWNGLDQQLSALEHEVDRVNRYLDASGLA